MMATHTYPTTPTTGKAMTPIELFQELRVLAASIYAQADLIINTDGDPGLEHPLLMLSQRFKELAEAEVSYE